MKARQYVVVMKTVSAVFAAAFVIVACSSSDYSGPICTADFRAGLVVYVHDSLSDTPIASGASLVARDGAYKDSVAFPAGRTDLNASPLSSAGERAGTYQVTVTKPGNLPWTKSNVVVTANECHVNTVTLTARLVPAP